MRTGGDGLKPGGKYHDYVDFVRTNTKANSVILIVEQGEHGSGMSVTSQDPGFNLRVPAILRQLADAIEAEQCN